MDSANFDNNAESVKDQPIHCTVEYNLSGDPVVLPRIGDEYQAQIPVLIDGTATFDDEKMGLTIPIRWSNYEVDNVNRLAHFQKCKGDVAKLKFGKLDNGRNKMVSPYLGSTPGDDGMVVERDYFPVPESVVESWTSLERDGFLLALYIFGKNFMLVRKFVESKKMNHVLSFYYGSFYGSDEHRRWSDCRKLRSKRCIVGQSIFKGWRQHELSSRLCSHLSEECQKSLLELSQNIGDEKISFEEYIFTLKESVGIHLLVEAVAIGKGKQDITRTVLDPVKANCAISGRSEIPVGKDCSSLSSEEIIKFLTGGFRLSKTRSSDLFWEAVWPLLLARGWHSEQPKDNFFPGSKHSLVFLIPGIKEFSRKLVKGNHYFDSVSDVLNKVASDPGLLELNTEADKGNDNEEETILYLPISQDQNGLSDEQCHQDLQPHNLNSSRGQMKFTVVDTSLYYGKGQYKVWSLRCLPAEVLGGCTESSSCVSSGVEESCEESKDKTNASSPALEMSDKGVDVNLAKSVSGILNNGASSALGPAELTEEDHETQKTSLLNCNQQIKVRKCSTAFDPTEIMEDDRETHKTSMLKDIQHKEIMNCKSRQEEESGLSNHMAPAIMHQSAIPCSLEKSICSAQNISTDFKLREPESICESNLPDMCDVQPLKQTDNTGAMINLYTPHMSPISSSMVQNDDDSHENISFLPEIKQTREALELSSAGTSTEQKSSLKNRRQSTRTRPLSTKALEALECEFLDPKRKRKGNDSSRSASSSKLSQRVRAKTENMFSYINVSNDIGGSMVKESGMTGVSGDEADVVSKA